LELPEMTDRKGVDVSSNNHPGDKAIDWPTVRADGYTWAAVKATEGTTYVNPYFAEDLKAAAAAGLEVVAYHFARPTANTGGDEARAFANALASQGFTGKRVIDLEDGRQLGWEWLAAWVRDFASVNPFDLIYLPISYAQGLEPYGFPYAAEVWEPVGPGQTATGPLAVTQTGQAMVSGIAGLVDIDAVAYEQAAPPVVPDPPTPPPNVVANVYLPGLMNGNHGPAVASLQALLNRHGGSLTVDGVFGELTATNLAQYQQANALNVSGLVDPGTWEHLLTT
jgi:hypothetical protein